MTFLKALQHAFIGYGIYRTYWKEELKKEDMILYWDEEQLRWSSTGKPYDPDGQNLICDWDATDWEAI